MQKQLDKYLLKTQTSNFAEPWCLMNQQQLFKATDEQRDEVKTESVSAKLLI